MPESSIAPLDQVDLVKAWQPWEPDAKNPWGPKWAGHLYRRAAFGANLQELRDSVQRGLPATLSLLLDGAPNAGERQRFLTAVGEGIARKNNLYELRTWWLYTMLHSLHPMQEKMTLFWHNHFATSIAKVGRTVMMFNQNRLLRECALGKFRPFLLAMSKDPAMLVWLDSNSNVRGTPNENYAREVMELFSLGVGHYTEKDIREAARAFTGWHTDDDQFEFVPKLHDDGAKTVLGRTGNWDGQDIIRIVLDRDDAARFMVRKLYRYFISETANPPDALLEPLAASFRNSDYDIAAVVKALLSSRHFFSAHAYRQRIKSPLEFTLSSVRAVVGDPKDIKPAALISKMESMGQQLFAPPNVKGWVGGEAWLNTATVIARHNFAQLVAGGQLRVSDYERRLAAVTNEFERRAIEEEEEARRRQEEAAAAEQAKLAKDGKQPVSAVPRSPELPRDRALDPAELIRREKITDPQRIVTVLLDLLLQGDVSKATRDKLIAFAADGKPQGPALDARVRETIHAIMTMPEFQLG